MIMHNMGNYRIITEHDINMIEADAENKSNIQEHCQFYVSTGWNETLIRKILIIKGHLNHDVCPA